MNEYNPYALISPHVPPLEEEPVIIQGGAKGADYLAKIWAYTHKFECIEYPADWKTYGRAAGPIRNLQMLKEGKPDLVVAFMVPNSRGTKHMVESAQKAGIQTRIVEILPSAVECL